MRVLLRATAELIQQAAGFVIIAFWLALWKRIGLISFEFASLESLASMSGACIVLAAAVLAAVVSVAADHIPKKGAAEAPRRQGPLRS